MIVVFKFENENKMISQNDCSDSLSKTKTKWFLKMISVNRFCSSPYFAVQHMQFWFICLWPLQRCSTYAVWFLCLWPSQNCSTYAVLVPLSLTVPELTYAVLVPLPLTVPELFNMQFWFLCLDNYSHNPVLPLLQLSTYCTVLDLGVKCVE